MLTTSRHPGEIHTGYHTTKPSQGVLGFMMSCLAGVIIFWVLLRLFKEDEISKQILQIATGLSLLGCLLFYLGTTWFLSFITGYSCKLSVSDNGIRYGAAYFAWPQVREIGARMKRGCFQVHLVLNRGWFAHHWLLTDDGMSLEMAEDLMLALKQQIAPQHELLVLTALPSPLKSQGSAKEQTKIEGDSQSNHA